MIKLTISLAGAAALAAGLATIPAAGKAQSNPLGQVIVYGDDP